MLVACLGDVMLDVIVELESGLSADDDSPARITFAAGGQAANVAAWVANLGGRSRVFGPPVETGPGQVAGRALADLGVEVWPTTRGGGGSVVSWVGDGTRSMASDAGDLSWLEELRFGPWLDGADWLFVSGYALLRTPDPQLVIETAAVARAHGTRIAVDLSSASMITRFGAYDFSRLCQALRPSVVFATDGEWATSAGDFGAGGSAVLVLKHGSSGASFVIDGVSDDRASVPGDVVDPTGAGDALAAGFLVGGIDLGMTAAARCVAHRGAQPAPTAP